MADESGVQPRSVTEGTVFVRPDPCPQESPEYPDQFQERLLQIVRGETLPDAHNELECRINDLRLDYTNAEDRLEALETFVRQVRWMLYEGVEIPKSFVDDAFEFVRPRRFFFGGRPLHSETEGVYVLQTEGLLVRLTEDSDWLVEIYVRIRRDQLVEVLSYRGAHPSNVLSVAYTRLQGVHLILSEWFF